MKNKIKSPLILLAVGALIIGASTAGATRAAVVYQSQVERVNFSTAALSIDLLEEVDGEYISVGENGKLTFSEIVNDESFKAGKKYTENVKVVNNSNQSTGYSEYVRVVVRKSWYKDGKQTSLDPGLIKLTVADGWYLNEDETTAEQEVYYMTSPLGCGNGADFITGIQIDNKVTNFVETKPLMKEGVEIKGIIENEYLYNGENVYIQLQADAVQTHNGEDAIYAAWGVKATCDAADDGNIIEINGVYAQ